MDRQQIMARLQKLDDLNGEIKVAKQMLKDALENDLLYQEVEVASKEARAKKKTVVNDIYNLPENSKIVENIKVSREEISALKEMLSEELIEYRHQHKTESIEGPDGQMRIFKFSVKLSSKPRDGRD